MLKYIPDWDKHLKKLDNSAQQKIWKKIGQLQILENIRHLKQGLPYFVVEIGQYRVCFLEKRKIRIIIFVGNHKQYEKWYKT